MTGKEKRTLMARSHALKPALTVTEGVTPTITTHLDQLLQGKDLVKVRFATEDRDECDAWAGELANTSGAELIRRTGRVAIYYRTPTAPADER